MVGKQIKLGYSSYVAARCGGDENRDGQMGKVGSGYIVAKLALFQGGGSSSHPSDSALTSRCWDRGVQVQNEFMRLD